MDGERTKIEGPEILQEGYPNLALPDAPRTFRLVAQPQKCCQPNCLPAVRPQRVFSCWPPYAYHLSHREPGSRQRCLQKLLQTSLLVTETMANANLVTSPIAAGFDAARREFLSNFPEEEKEAFSKFTSVDDVYDATDEIQKQQAKTRTLQNLGKIQPYIECLNQYSGVVETIVQIKPDFLAIIWVFTVSWCL